MLMVVIPLSFAVRITALPKSLSASFCTITSPANQRQSHSNGPESQSPLYIQIYIVHHARTCNQNNWDSRCSAKPLWKNPNPLSLWCVMESGFRVYLKGYAWKEHKRTINPLATTNPLAINREDCPKHISSQASGASSLTHQGHHTASPSDCRGNP
jgi:hypothetical protein